MKTMIGVGLAMLALVLVVALRLTGDRPQLVPVGNSVAAESQLISKVTPAGRPEASALPATQQSEPLHAILLAAIDAEIDPDRRSEVLERAVESVPDVDLPALLDSLAHDANPGAAELSLLLVRRWAENHPAASAEWTSQLPETPARHAALEQVAIAWADTDLAAATSWVQALPDGDSKQAATLALAYEAARSEPVSALELASTLPATRARDDLLVHAVSQWAATDSTTAAAWAMEVADPTLRERLVASVAIVLAEQDGAAAVRLAVNSLVAGDEQDRAGVSIVQRWAQNSPQAAASWVSQFPDIPSRVAAVQNLLALWTAQDAGAAGDWLRELPAGSLRAVGITAYARALADHDPTSVEAVTAGGM